MAKEEQLLVQTRTETGSTAVRRLRKEGLIPGTVNMAGGSAVSIQLEGHAFEQRLHHHTSENLILDVKLDKGAAKKMLLKDVQHDGITGDVLHVDFIEIDMTAKMRVRIPVELVGEPVGVAQDGGILDHLLREVEVECLPTELIEKIEVDVSALAVNDSIQVSDLKVPEAFEVLTAEDVAVAAVAPPRLEEEVAEPVEGEEGAEPGEAGEAGEKKEGDGEAGEAKADEPEKKE